MKLSIITINYNNREGLRKTIESVVNQTCQDFEYIVIDGGSTDGSAEVIKEFEDKIDSWVSEPDKGIYNAMTVFSKQVATDIICGNTHTNKLKVPPQEITLDYLFNNSICHQCAFIRTSLMKKYGYDENYKIVADRKFFIQALILDNCSYQAVNVDVVNSDINGFSATNPVLSRLEYDKVLEELIPQRIRLDYGRKYKGELYGDTWYDKLFIEIRNRKYKRPIYTLVTCLLRVIAIFHKSAKFIKLYPYNIHD